VRGRRVLVIDDDPSAIAVIRALYEECGAEVTTSRSAEEGLRALYATRPDLVVLEIAVEGGWTALDRIRELDDVPILVLTELGDATVGALRAGADDCLIKPFDADEVAARSESLLRRSASGDEPRTYADALVEIDFQAADARAAGKPLNLTPLEFRLLRTFVRNRDRVLSAEELLAIVWGESDARRQRVKLAVSYLREKFRKQGVEPPIVNVRGFGYRYRPTAPSSPAQTIAAQLDADLAKFEPLFAPLEELRGPSGQRFFPSRAARKELAAALGDD
jgi:DNA-binding response OmpR family regulator